MAFLYIEKKIRQNLVRENRNSRGKTSLENIILPISIDFLNKTFKKSHLIESNFYGSRSKAPF